MPNPIKYTAGTETLALKKGNFYIGTGDVGKGPSDTTGYYQGPSPASGGYVVYLNKNGVPGNLSYHSAANDSQLISFTNNLSGTSFTSATQCLNYYATQTDKVCFNRDYEGIVTNGLVLNVDAGFTPSYSRSGTTWYDISGSNNGTLTNGPTFNSGDGGGIVFDGVDDYVNCLNNTNITGSNPSTIEVFCKFSSVPNNFVNPIIQIGEGTGLGNFRLLYLRYVSEEYAQPRLAVAWYTKGFAYDFTPNVNQIYNFTYTDDGTNESKLYINGSLVMTYGGYGPLLTNTNQLYIGKFTYTSPNFSGTMYNTKIYNRVLSADEVLQNYNAQKGRFGL